jgi:Flp pilus assembly protein TadD
MVIAVLLLSFALYLVSATPSVNLHDSGEMVCAVWLLGISHPPGYPLYCLLGKLFVTALPFGNIAFRMNIISCASASLAVMMVYLISLRLTGVRGLSSCIPAIVASLSFASSRIFWQQAVIAEKYTLNAFFLGLLIFILLKWQESIRNTQNAIRILYLFSFLLGLSFCHHFQTIFVVPAALFFISVVLWQNRPKQVRKKNPVTAIFSTLNTQHSTLTLLSLFAFPLTLYLYLPIRAATHPAANWGSPDTLQRLISHITVKEYTHYFAPPDQWLSNLFSHIPKFFPHQFTLPLLAIGIAGGILLFRNSRRLFVFFSLILLFDIANSIRYNIHNIEDYYIPAFFVLSVFIGYALHSVGIFISKKRPLLSTLYSLLSTLLIFLPLLTNYYYCNRDRSYYSYDYGRNILRPVEKDAILFIMGDTFAFPLWYLVFVERVREDVALIDKLELRYDWYCEQLKERYTDIGFSFAPQGSPSPHLVGVRFLDIVKRNIEDRAIYIPLPFADEAKRDYILIPEGICHRIVQKTVDISKEIEKGRFRFLCRATGVFMEERTRHNWDNYLIAYDSRARFLSERGLYNDAIVYFKKALELEPEHTSSLYGLGLVYKDIGELDRAEDAFSRLLEMGDRADAHYGLGMVYQKRKEYERAIAEYRRATELDPKQIFLHHALGACLLEVEDYEGAISAFKEALNHNPNDPNTYYNLAIVYWKMRRIEDAISAYQKVLKEDPNYPGVKESLRVLLTRR